MNIHLNVAYAAASEITTPSVTGAVQSTITIANTDADDDSHTFTIRGEGSTPYGVWAVSVSGLSGAHADPIADPNKDGVANGFAYLFGAPSANVQSGHLVPTGAVGNGNV